MTEQETRYWIWSLEHNQWWRWNRCGYVSDIHNAGIYVKAEAEEICRNANIAELNEIMIPSVEIFPMFLSASPTKRCDREENPSPQQPQPKRDSNLERIQNLEECLKGLVSSLLLAAKNPLTFDRPELRSIDYLLCVLKDILHRAQSMLERMDEIEAEKTDQSHISDQDRQEEIQGFENPYQEELGKVFPWSDESSSPKPMFHSIHQSDTFLPDEVVQEMTKACLEIEARWKVKEAGKKVAEAIQETFPTILPWLGDPKAEGALKDYLDEVEKGRKEAMKLCAPEPGQAKMGFDSYKITSPKLVYFVVNEGDSAQPHYVIMKGMLMRVEGNRGVIEGVDGSGTWTVEIEEIHKTLIGAELALKERMEARWPL